MDQLSINFTFLRPAGMNHYLCRSTGMRKPLQRHICLLMFQFPGKNIARGFNTKQKATGGSIQLIYTKIQAERISLQSELLKSDVKLVGNGFAIISIVFVPCSSIAHVVHHKINLITVGLDSSGSISRMQPPKAKQQLTVSPRLYQKQSARGPSRNPLICSYMPLARRQLPQPTTKSTSK